MCPFPYLPILATRLEFSSPFLPNQASAWCPCNPPLRIAPLTGHKETQCIYQVLRQGHPAEASFPRPWAWASSWRTGWRGCLAGPVPPPDFPRACCYLGSWPSILCHEAHQFQGTLALTEVKAGALSCLSQHSFLFLNVLWTVNVQDSSSHFLLREAFLTAPSPVPQPHTGPTPSF